MSCEYGKEQSAKKSYDKKDYKEMPGSQLKNAFFFLDFVRPEVFVSFFKSHYFVKISYSK